MALDLNYIRVFCSSCNGRGEIREWNKACEDWNRKPCEACEARGYVLEAAPKKSKLRGVVSAKVYIDAHPRGQYDHPEISLSDGESTVLTLRFQRNLKDSKDTAPTWFTSFGSGERYTACYGGSVKEGTRHSFDLWYGNALQEAARLAGAISKASQRLHRSGVCGVCELALAVHALRLLGVSVEVLVWENGDRAEKQAPTAEPATDVAA